jgi:hypothetical protein
MQHAAAELVASRGLEALSLRTLSELPNLDVTRSAPLHYFGSTLGLLAAIAAHGLDEVMACLREHRARAGADDVTGLAVAYGKFGLQNPGLYRAMHQAVLWKSVGQSGLRRGAATERAVAKAWPWIERAIAARAAAFQEVVLAVQAGQRAGTLVLEPAEMLARHLAQLVDGFLFQSLEEQVGAERPLAEQLDDLRSHMDLAMTGLVNRRETPHAWPLPGSELVSEDRARSEARGG